MDSLRILRIELDRANVAALLQWNRNHERPRHVRSAARKHVGFGERDLDVGLSEAPPVAERRRARQIARLAALAAACHPSLNDFYVLIRQPADAVEIVAASGFP